MLPETFYPSVAHTHHLFGPAQPPLPQDQQELGFYSSQESLAPSFTFDMGFHTDIQHNDIQVPLSQGNDTILPWAEAQLVHGHPWFMPIIQDCGYDFQLIHQPAMSGSSYSTSSSSMIVGPSLSPVTSEDSFAQQPYNTPHQLQHQLQYFHSPSMSTCWTGSPALTVSSMPEDPVVIDLVPEAPDRMDDTPNPSSPSNLDHFSAVSSVAVSSQTTAPPPRRPAPPAPANSSDAKSNIQCDVCLKTFTRPYNLNSHKAVHSDEKPYKCSICSTHFKRHHDKTRHEREHKGDYRYNCQYCNKKFTRVDTRNRHFRTYAPCGRRWKLEHPNVSLGQSSRCKARR